jgi:hypothetical protein
MKTFITEVAVEGVAYAGPETSALTWAEAQDIAGKIKWRGQGTSLVGELAN